MNDQVKKLSGSRRNDLFKTLHKELLPANCYGSDLDFVAINAYGPVGALDYKYRDEPIRWSEHKLYSWFIQNGIKVYIIRDWGDVDVKEGKFSIYRYNSDKIYEDTEVLVYKTENWEDYKNWEIVMRGEK